MIWMYLMVKLILNEIFYFFVIDFDFCYIYYICLMFHYLNGYYYYYYCYYHFVIDNVMVVHWILILVVQCNLVRFDLQVEELVLVVVLVVNFWLIILMYGLDVVVMVVFQLDVDQILWLQIVMWVNHKLTFLDLLVVVVILVLVVG